MNRAFLLVAILALAGCAHRFGHRNEQTTIFISSEPPRLPYFVLDRAEAEKTLVAGPHGLEIRHPKDFQRLLDRQLQGLVSDSTELNYSVGSYLVAVRCAAGFRFQQIDAKSRVKTVAKVSCI